ncbi:MAG: Hsp20/alpha crystallin family protein [Gammaproteobacteria bacterium]|nr:Hsp20/alpha crystallin family protein [Gammaproteobacteria bacterium]
MKLVPRDPFINAFPQMKDLSRFFNMEMDDDNTLTSGNWTPAVDIAEKEDHFLIEADVPGVDPEDIEVSMENGYLTVKGERESESKDEKDGYSRVERLHGSFYRRFSLPETADLENVSATSNKGVLEIKVGKAEVAKPKKISVNVK